MNNRKFIFKTLRNSALILAMLSGCSNQQPLPPPEPNSAAAKIIYLGNLSFISVNDLRMIPATATNKFPIVNADIVNNSEDYNSIEYRLQWRDQNGIAVGTEEEWKTLSFSPQQLQRIKGSATSKYAVDFKLELKSKN